MHGLDSPASHSTNCTRILALDRGKFNSVLCVYDLATAEHRFTSLATTPAAVHDLLVEHQTADPAGTLLVIETCDVAGWVYDIATTLGIAVAVANPSHEAWRWTRVKRKTDKDDALKLARMAAINELKPVHMPSEKHREFRSLVKYRKTLDARITKSKCTIRAWFVNHGISIDRGEKAWHTGRERINSFRKPLEQCGPNELWKGELDLELTQLDSLTKHMDVVVKKLEAIGRNDPRIVRLQTVPGMGPRTAEILVACIDDPHRFENGRQVSAYFGLVPRQFQSGETDRNGRITQC